MFRFLRPSLFHALKRPRATVTRPKPGVFARTATFTTAAVTLSALALHTTSNDPTQFQSKPDSDPNQSTLSSLLRAYLVFSLCSLPSLVDASPAILGFLSNIPVLKDVSEAFLKVTFFDQFVGAETIDACVPLLHKLRRSNQGVLFCYSVEQPHPSHSNPTEPTIDASQQALQSILRSIDVAADFEDSLSPSPSPRRSANGSWVAIKLSTLLPQPETNDPTRNPLWVLSQCIVRRHASRRSAIKHEDPQLPFPGAPDAQDFQLFLDPTDNTDVAQHIQSLATLHANLRKICALAQARGIRLTIDAEETWFQPAIDLYSILLMREFNSLRPSRNYQVSAPQPLIYITLQAYLVRAPTFLDFLIAHARQNDYALGVKLVRGAYVDAEVAAHVHAKAHANSTLSPLLSTENAMAKAHPGKGSKSISPDVNPPTYPSKEATDAAYDACVRVLVGEVASDLVRDRVEPQGETVPRIAVLFGTHNWKSSKLVLDEIVRFGLGEEVVDESGLGERNDDTTKLETRTGKKKIVLSEEVRQRICMAQLYGMSDSLAAYIVDRTQTLQTPTSSPFVIRYMPYGPLRDVMPYLARRAVENRSVLGSGGDAEEERGEANKAGGGGGAAEERRRIGRLIWERVVGVWRF